VWSATDPYNSTQVVVDNIDLQAQWVCGSNLQALWGALLIIYFAALFGWGLYVVYDLWNIRRAASDTRWLLISIYNLVLVFCILVPLASVASIDSDHDSGLIALVAILFASTSTVAGVIVPSLIKKLRRTSNEKNSKNTNLKGKQMSVILDKKVNVENSGLPPAEQNHFDR